MCLKLLILYIQNTIHNLCAFCELFSHTVGKSKEWYKFENLEGTTFAIQTFYSKIYKGVAQPMSI